MLDFGAVPPEINSARMYSGPGSGSMMAAAAAWDVLANGLESTSRGYSSVLSRLQGESWSGGASEAMASATAPYVAWMTAAGAQAEEAASQARAAAAAYESAFAATVPPALIEANRIQLANLVATNIFGQNTTTIGATEAAYEQMWAQDSAAMYGYAGSSSAATMLTQFTQPPQTTNAAGPSAQAAAVAQATGSSTAANVQTALSQAMSSVPRELQALSTAGSSGSSSSSSLSSSLSSAYQSLLTYVGDFNTLTGPENLAAGFSRTATSAGSFLTGVQRALLQSGPKIPKVVAPPLRSGLTSASMRGQALANVGQATTVGKLSVPPSWAATDSGATTVAEPHWLSDAELDGGPSWHEGSATNLWNGVPPAGREATSGLLPRPSVNNVLRVGPRRFMMPRPSLGG